MSRTTIDLDDEQLAAATRELGTTAKLDTVSRRAGARRTSDARAPQPAPRRRHHRPAHDCSRGAVQAVVLHHNSDFEHIASVSGQQTMWVVPRGSAG